MASQGHEWFKSANQALRAVRQAAEAADVSINNPVEWETWDELGAPIKRHRKLQNVPIFKDANQQIRAINVEKEYPTNLRLSDFDALNKKYAKGQLFERLHAKKFTPEEEEELANPSTHDADDPEFQGTPQQKIAIQNVRLTKNLASEYEKFGKKTLDFCSKRHYPSSWAWGCSEIGTGYNATAADNEVYIAETASQ
ncbi:MAG: hypothetical protein MMC23_007027 [Stictis urceolatum]|nr:hypothetical protein [Stictis urceolata]